GEGGLPHPGGILEEEMASGDDGGERQLHGVALAANHAGEGVGGAGEQLVRGRRRVGGKGQGGGSHRGAASLAGRWTFEPRPPAPVPPPGPRSTGTSVAGAGPTP